MNVCSCCEKPISITDPILSFRKCLNEHGKWAHRYCKNCWFDILLPVSQEKHLTCLGCQKKIPLWYFPKPQKNSKTTPQKIQVVQLLEDD